MFSPDRFIVACLFLALAGISVFGAVCGKAVQIDLHTEFYFVGTGKVYSIDAAQSVSGIICSGGGAGVVMEEGDGYIAVYSMYLRREAAQSVCNNLKNGGQKAEVFTRNAPPLYLPAADVKWTDSVIAAFERMYGCIAVLIEVADGLARETVTFAGAKRALEDVALILDSVTAPEKERYRCLGAGAEMGAEQIRGYLQGLFTAADIRTVYVQMGDIYIQTAKKLSNRIL